MTILRSEHQHFGRNEMAKTDLRATRSNGLFFEILLVDDEPLILSPLSLCLEDSSHRVTTALGGQNALDLLRGKPFDLVITDLQMPGIDGIALLRTAKEIRSNTKVIIMTGSVLSASARRLISREADGFLDKPFSLAELHRAVASCLGNELLSSDPCNQDFSGSLEALPP
jgi:CheY-like chemotaxis protein